MIGMSIACLITNEVKKYHYDNISLKGELKMARFEGVYVATVTPMTEDFKVDYRRLYDMCDWMISEGVHGLVPMGSLGEYATMTNEERAKIVETTMDVAKGRVPVVPGVAAPSTAGVIEWMEHAKKHGAEGVMALPPINYKPLENEVIEHFKAINDVGIPVVAYNNPRDYPVDLTPDFLEKISQYENIVGIKEFSGDIRRVHDILDRTNLEVMIGVDDLAMEGAAMGATGWISGVPNALPKEGVDLFNKALQKDLSSIINDYRDLLPLFHLDTSPQLVQYIKEMMRLAGQPVGPTRPPRLALPQVELDKVKVAFDRARKVANNG